MFQILNTLAIGLIASYFLDFYKSKRDLKVDKSLIIVSSMIVFFVLSLFFNNIFFYALPLPVLFVIAVATDINKIRKKRQKR
ncbi:hypothetical protein D0463_05200 [Bacillus sp. V59.32b]|nr:hypothetical protein D0463_05200 [Bacillus sp. V59.32b]